MNDYEQNADVSKTLTDKWKKGELPEDFYYVISDSEFIKICYVKQNSTDYIKLICSKVPSYKQWQAKLEENTKLKELLKDCREILYEEEMVSGNPRYIDELRILIKRLNQVLGDKING